MQPVIIEDNISIAANSVNDNVIVSNSSLRRYLRAPFPAMGKIVATISALGLRISLDYGSKNVIADSDLRVAVAPNLMSDTLDTVNDVWFPNEGDQLVLRAANSTGAAISLNYRITLTDMTGQQLPPDCQVMQRGPVNIAIGAVDFQLLNGLRYERAPVPSLMKVLMSASASGLNRQVFVDTQSIAPPSAVVASNRVPQDPFDLSVESVECDQDKQIELSTSNPTAGALNIFWKQVLQNLQRS
jgi:hypothetical protein